MISKEFQLQFSPDTNISFVSGFILEANRFNSAVEICQGDMCVDAKTFWGLLQLEPHSGAHFTVRTCGDDEIMTMECIETYIGKYI